MIDAGQNVDGRIRAGAPGFFDPARWQLRRDLVIEGSLDQHLPSRKWKQIARTAGAVALGMIGWTAAHEAVYIIPAMGEGRLPSEFYRKPEIDSPRKRDNTTGRDRGRAALQVTAVRQMIPASVPEREMATGGVAQRDDAREIEGVGFSQNADEIEARSCVLKGRRPTAAARSGAAVLYRPAGDALITEGAAQAAGIGEVALGLPPTAVKEDDHRNPIVVVRPREPQIAELRWVITVGNAVIGPEDRLRQNVHASIIGLVSGQHVQCKVHQRPTLCHVEWLHE